MSHGCKKTPDELSDHDMVVVMYERIETIFSDMKQMRKEVKKNSNFRVQFYFLMAIVVALSPYIIFLLNKFFGQ